MADVRIGISGWSYDGWRGSFYPKGLHHNDELHYASRAVNSIEINGSFYGTQQPKSYMHWYEQAPKDFIFAVKGNRFITHTKRLREVERPLANFFSSGVLALGEKLGPILWQLPAQVRFDEGVVKDFLSLLPHSFREATHLGKKHDEWMDTRSFLGPPGFSAEIRHTFEIRNESFVTDKFFQLLQKHNIALTIAESGGRWPYLEQITANFLYIRFHGSKEVFETGYGARRLSHWVRRIERWRTIRRRKLDVYVYFNNDAKTRAPFDAMTLMKMFHKKYT